MKFRLLRGTHFEDGHLYRSREDGRNGTAINNVVTTDIDLASLHGTAKFERAGRWVDEDEPSMAPTKAKDIGPDVTNEFAVASEAGFAVHRKGNDAYFVLNEDGKVLNSTPLAKKKVRDFIEETATATASSS